MKEKRDVTPPINEQIKSPQVQLITQHGENVGVVSRQEALRMAEAAGLDLVMLAESGQARVPVVKIMDFGRLLYEKKKKQAAAKKRQRIIQIKEIKMRPTIGEHDYQTKIKHIIEFLRAGKHVKVTLFFKGREGLTKKERGAELFAKINQSFADHGLLENVVQERDVNVGQIWSRVYYLKELK